MIAIEPSSRQSPHSEESERAVLAAILLDATRHLPLVASRLQFEDFYFDRHRRLFRSMVDLQEEGIGIDLRTLQARLEQQKDLETVGGLSYIVGLDLDLPDLSRVDSYVEIIKERALRRRLMDVCTEVFRNCLDGGLEAQDALAMAEQRVLELGDQSIAKGMVSIGLVLKETLVELERLGEEGFPGIRSGFPDFDRMSHGLNPGNLLVLAGRPGMGKTSYALNVAQHVAIRERKGVCLFSLEMSQREISMRVLASEADVEFARVRMGRVDRDWPQLLQTVRRIGESPLFIDDSSNPSMLEVASKCRRLRSENRCDLVIIDYLQLMSAGVRYENRNLEIASITRGLKQLAKELAVPVLALSQLSRQPERRGADHRPQLADLRESGAIEQDADLVAFIYRDEVYHPDEENHGLAELIVAKNRHGETGTIELAFLGDTTTFRSIDRHARPPAGFGEFEPA